MAALKACPGYELLPCEQFEVAFQALSQWMAERAVLPIENSLGGSIHTVYDLLLRYNLHIVGETSIAVKHCLMALPGTRQGGGVLMYLTAGMVLMYCRAGVLLLMYNTSECLMNTCMLTSTAYVFVTLSKIFYVLNNFCVPVYVGKKVHQLNPPQHHTTPPTPHHCRHEEIRTQACVESPTSTCTNRHVLEEIGCHPRSSG